MGMVSIDQMEIAVLQSALKKSVGLLKRAAEKDGINLGTDDTLSAEIDSWVEQVGQYLNKAR